MSNHMQENKPRMKNNSKDEKLKKMIVYLIAFLFILIIIERTQEKTISKDKLTLIVQNQNITESLKDSIIENNNAIYLSFDDVKKVFDSNLFIEEKSNLIITTGDKKVAAFTVESQTSEINGSKVEMNVSPFKTENGKIYLPISELKNVYDMEYSYIAETKNIVIDYFSKELKKADVVKDSKVKNSTSKLSKTIDKVEKGESVVFISSKNGWAKIRTKTGMIGYLRDNKVNNIRTERENFEDNKSTTENQNYLEKSLNKVSLATYTERKELIQNIIFEAVKDGYKAVKVSCENKNDDFNRFKIESKPMLKECGINIEFE